LDHPNIVQVYSTGLTPMNQPYIAMQFINGGSLGNKLKQFAEQGKLVPTEQALAIVRQIANALGVAHQAGVVHRDLKPGNILIRTDGTPVLVDLGIAAVQGGPKLTQTGNLIGTPNYMSPEQVRGLPLDGRSDLYSLGVILYELLSGKRPFDAPESIAILHKHVYEAPEPLGNLRRDLNPETLQVVETSLAKDPAARYQNAAQMVAAIDRAMTRESGGAPVRQTTVWLPNPHESDLINRSGVMLQATRFPTPAKPTSPRKINPMLIGGIVAATAVIAIALFLIFGRGGGDGNEEVAGATLTVPTRSDNAGGSPVQATSTQAPTLTPLPPLPADEPTAAPTDIPTLTPLPHATDTAVPTNTPQPQATPTIALPTTYTGTDGKLMRLVPAGEFLMGSTSSQVDAAVALCRASPDRDSCVYSEFASELPQREVYLTAFYMDETEVTNNEYRACVTAGYCDAPDAGTGTYSRSNYYDRASTYGNYPVVFISWSDARNYCSWAGERLPSEAEWEKAARGTDGRLFPWGNTFDTSRANTEDRGTEVITAVGSFPSGASPYGIYDMAGNVWEYTNDWFDPDYYASAPDTNPPGPNSSPSGEKVLRSGSFANYQHYARVANRGAVTPTSSTQFRGIRCVVDAGN
ncbi:MAG: SUMF1/EgtB/PvdO family nonheme iron enzyme, partial [Anaerolineales bacterium]|nr:SUMF1/EgtB/PvdO family nonheme iron enzyme [Anaerolineales bacterium]